MTTSGDGQPVNTWPHWVTARGDFLPSPTIREGAYMTVPLGQRVPNDKLRAQRLAGGRSQARFAAAIRHAGEVAGEPNRCTKRLVQKWESGEHTSCAPHYRRALERVTYRPYSQLGFAGTRREPLPSTIPGLLVAMRLPVSEARLVAGEPGERLRFALERSGRATADVITVMEATTIGLFALEHHQSAERLLPTAGWTLDDVSRLLAGTRPEALRRRLMRVGGHIAALAGWLTFDRGDLVGAYRYWDSALEVAQQTADGPLMAYVLVMLSQSAADRDDSQTAWQLAHTAAAHAGDDSRARAWMLARAAQEAARLGERAAALVELTAALELGGDLGPAGPEDRTAPWVRFVDGAYCWSLASEAYGRLGDHNLAHKASLNALDRLGVAHVRTRARILLEASRALFRVGEYEEATRRGRKGKALAKELQDILALRQVKALGASLADPANGEERT
jgi:hypothetical protein